jgi:hypothetical protein
VLLLVDDDCVRHERQVGDIVLVRVADCCGDELFHFDDGLALLLIFIIIC